MFVLLLNVCTGTLTARLLGPYGRGELAIAFRWSGLFIMLFTIGLPGAVIYLGKKFSEKQGEYLGAYLILGPLIGLVGFATGELMIPHLLSHQPHEVIRLAELSMCSVPFGVVADGLVGSLQSLNQFGKVLWLRVINELGTIAVILALILMGVYGIRHYIISTIAWSIAVFILTLLWVIHAIHPRFSVSLTQAQQLFTKGVQIYAGSLVNVFGGNIDQLVISLFLSPYTMGLYAVCISISGMLPSLVTSTVLIFLWPKLMDMMPQDRHVPVQRLHSTLLYSTIGISVVIGLLLPIALPFIYGHHYAGAIPTGEVLLLSGPVIVGYVVLANYLSTLGKFNVVTVAEVTALTLGVCTTYPLSHIYGGVGAAIGVFVASFTKWIFLMRASCRSGIAQGALFHPDRGSILFVRELLLRKLLRLKVE